MYPCDEDPVMGNRSVLVDWHHVQQVGDHPTYPQEVEGNSDFEEEHLKYTNHIIITANIVN